MKNVSAELKVIVDNSRVLLDKNSKFKYSVRHLYDLANMQTNFLVWMEGNGDQKGLITKLELVEGVDYKKVRKTVSNNIKRYDYNVTIEVYAYFVLMLGLLHNINAIEILQDHINFAQSDDAAKQLMAATGRNDVVKVLEKFKLI